MSRIDELVTEMCPDGVEFLPLGDLVRIRNGKDYKSLGEGAVPVYGTGGVMLHVDTAAHSGPSVLIPRKGSLDKIYYVDEPFWTVDTIFYTEIGPRVLPKYLYHYLLTQRLEELNQAGGIPSLTQSVLNRLLVPVPPLEVQQEIVRILDQFTQLEAELEAELEARRRQYEHYSEMLLKTVEGTPRFKLGEVATVVRGASPRPIQRFLTDSDAGVPWIKIGDVPPNGKYIMNTSQRVTREGALKSRRVAPGDFVLSNSMSFGRPYISAIEGYIHDGWLAISAFEDRFSSDYLYYLLRSEPVQRQFAAKAGAGTVKNLNAEIVRGVEVPCPPRNVQNCVVKLLDQFDALVNDLSIGLPAELAERRKQYEYYRDKLLTFKELEQ